MRGIFQGRLCYWAWDVLCHSERQDTAAPLLSPEISPGIGILVQAWLVRYPGQANGGMVDKRRRVAEIVFGAPDRAYNNE